MDGMIKDRWPFGVEYHASSTSAIRTTSLDKKTHRLLKGSSAPIEPFIVEYNNTSAPPGTRVVLRTEVTTSPT